MIPLLGTVAVITAVVGAVWLAAAGLRAVTGAVPARARLRAPVLTLVWGSVAAQLILLVALVADDFSVTYVANHHASTTPFLWTIASSWGALEGSIVLWGLMLGAFTWWVWRTMGDDDRLSVVALGVMAVVSIFFFGLMATVANPFEVCVRAGEVGCFESSWWPFSTAEAPAEGRGPNPLLQNHVLMAVHPPTLYVGYVGFTAPFAFGIAALLLGRPGSEWALRTRRWALVSWSFLTVGILLGAWWAYEVLGWGGYWGWDPVENASLLPWLTATALLHSVAVQLRRGMLEAWNFVLAIATFALTIFGTFLTRSGTITSVHSFTQSAVGPLLLGFFLLITVVGLGIFASRVHLVSGAPRPETLVSREGGILVNSLLMTVLTLTVLLGTVYPIVVEAISGTTIGIARGFFDATTVPVALVLLLVMAAGQVTPWRSTTREVMTERLLIPVQVALAVGAVAVVAGLRARGPLLAVVLATFVATPPLLLLIRQARRRPEPVLQAAALIVRNDRAYWGGMLAHLGVAILAVGIAGSAGMASHADDVAVARGETVSTLDHEFTYRTGFTATEPQRRVVGATVEVTRDGRPVATIRPRLNDYGTQVVPTPGVHSGLLRDVYVTLRAVDSSRVVLDVSVFPLQWMVWVGGFTVAAGGLAALGGRRGRIRATTGSA